MKAYENNGDVIVVSSEDFTGRRLFKQRVNADDPKSVARIFKSVIDKYGLDLRVVEEKSGNKSWLDVDEEFKW